MGSVLLVEMKDKTFVFNTAGVKDKQVYIADMHIRPKDKICVVNRDRGITKEQIKKFKIVKTDKFIKRKGDSSLIIPVENFCMVIYPSGNMSKWCHSAAYSENELFKSEEIEKIKIKEPKIIKEEEKEIDDIQDDELKIGDIVSFDYYGESCIGKIVHIYNNGESVNVSWDGKQTSYFYKSVRKM